MAKLNNSKQFLWTDWQAGQLPQMEVHSEKKLDLLRDYLVLYLEIVLAKTRGKTVQELTLIDGFSGGGAYGDGKRGSPFTILTAVREAEELINRGREKAVRIVPICYFVEQNREAAACLEYHLREAGYGPDIGKTIHLRCTDFVASVPEIIADVRERHKRGGNRTIFFLDQCGYSEIHPLTIQKIDQELNGRAEFIINFSIGWFGDFLSDATVKNYTSVLKNLGLDSHVDPIQLLQLRQTLGGSWRHAVESHIGRGYHLATGIKFFSPFYIEPHDNHRGYWLLHLAQNQRARAAMTEIHWSKANRSKHYGPHGYGILSYKPDLDPTLYIDGMSFNESTRTVCLNQLADDFGRLVRDKYTSGISYTQLSDLTCNDTIADTKMLDDALWRLFAENHVDIQSHTGLQKRSRTFMPADLIVPKRQLIFSAFGEAVIPRSRSKQTQAN